MNTARSTEGAARSQSLSRGAAGEALLLIERAHSGIGTWDDVHSILRTVTAHGLLAGDDASLFFGAPAVAFVLHTAAAGTDRYAGALHTLDASVAAVTDRRLTMANARIDRGERPQATEFDVLYGLTGLGAYWLRRDPLGPQLQGVLSYLVRLVQPLAGDPAQLPGWWVNHGPTTTPSDLFCDGHANVGMAHGIAGPLALLALSKRHGITVEGHVEAMTRICAWLDGLRREDTTGLWWPRWITLPEQHTGTLLQPEPAPPSWCYATPGLARAQQLAALALQETERQRMAEDALLRCLTDPVQMARVQESGLCHGTAGLLQITHRAAQDAPSGIFTTALAQLRNQLLAQDPTRENGFLGGPTGAALALEASANGGIPASVWDASLLIT
ncbi:lanthionine synthetase C family protein [Streptomyces sp. NBC_00690]|uniref:lanthionine synthetase C family protein n=1 Tax=Streptomyces sp. NBC_00690 TaxID=2975808 RepID=UPI002E2847FD|nr:lanthionine synthetase C family protein [Streptomyces sp. NBC_00690]